MAVSANDKKDIIIIDICACELQSYLGMPDMGKHVTISYFREYVIFYKELNSQFFTFILFSTVINRDC